MYYNTANPTAYVTPDVLLAYGVAVPSEEDYAPWEYGKVPDLVMEMASPSTHAQDSGFKRECYAALGIPEYWQHDPHHLYLTEDLLGWRLRDGAYVPIPLQPDPARSAWIGRSVVLDTDWGLDMASGRLRLWNPVQGRWYLTVDESGPAHEEEAARANQEAAQARQAEAARDQEAARASREAARAREAEAEIARLQALLRRQGHAPKNRTPGPTPFGSKLINRTGCRVTQLNGFCDRATDRLTKPPRALDRGGTRHGNRLGTGSGPVPSSASTVARCESAWLSPVAWLSPLLSARIDAGTEFRPRKHATDQDRSPFSALQLPPWTEYRVAHLFRYAGTAV